VVRQGDVGVAPSASSRQRRRASFLRSRAHVVPMHRMQRLRPSGTSAGRPRQASRATEPRRSLVEEGERFGAAVGRLRCLSLACRSDGRPPRGL